MNVRRYLYGWAMWWRTFRLARRKKHGAGKMKLFHATKAAACERAIVDGQFRNQPRWPRYLVRWSRR